jgi:hypothetical protein
MNAQTKITPSVYRKLSEARRKFHALELKKTGHNTFANYKYFELGDFLIPALKVFDDVGLLALPVSFTADTATMTIVDMDNPESRIEFTSPMGSAALKGCHEVQNIGAVETYQRRYLWVAALEIVEHDALDASSGADNSVKGADKITDSQVGVLQGYASGGVIDAARFCKFFQIASLKDLPADRYDEALRMAQAKQEQVSNRKPEPVQ